VSDAYATSVERPGGSIITDLWQVQALPAQLADGNASTDAIGLAPPTEGAVVRMCTFPPDSEMDMEAFEQAMREIYGPQDRAGHASPVRGMHRTDTVDVVTVIYGELYVVLETGDTLLRQGDSLIQLGTAHAWSNRSDRPATVVSVMMGARR
jgi:hypothetical protein